MTQEWNIDRVEAEFLVDVLERQSRVPQAQSLAAEIRELFGMSPQNASEDMSMTEPPDRDRQMARELDVDWMKADPDQSDGDLFQRLAAEKLAAAREEGRTEERERCAGLFSEGGQMWPIEIAAKIRAT